MDLKINREVFHQKLFYQEENHQCFKMIKDLIRLIINSIKKKINFYLKQLQIQKFIKKQQKKETKNNNFFNKTKDL